MSNAMTVKATLQAARALIDTPAKWCQHWSDAEGRICAVHALTQVTGNMQNIAYEESYRLLSSAIDGQVLGPWNDQHTHAEVMAAFDRAIASAIEAPDLSGIVEE